jgi:hypothetical protein
MNYNKRFQELKRKYFPELKDRQIIFEKANQKVFMKAFPLNNKVYYNEQTMKNCPSKARDAAFVHELFHKLQFYRMNFIKRVLVLLFYLMFQKVRIKIEYEANIETVKRGFGKGLLELNEYVKKRVGKQLWENKVRDLHLSKEEIKEIES